ncbi:26S proteasome subunit RPN7-domain-containing protein [Suillus plorans]|uniref:26S proteasome subunit RPN7-domain-containing protein n=1 Tax=Suillus plorans TaxID=116603 RepID=A0A9P7AK66_9AGAM|nr:26S proteasome subunit RPN7-domain-containing protein [Suillus plorans]KAG1791207.1 26S proteasome subunit RPN7-domain-containing protein [Suillus plorans]
MTHFVASCLSTFEFAFITKKRAPPPLTAAAKCLALCIKLSLGDDTIMFNMYSLLNYIAATSKEISESSSSNQLLSNPLYASSITSPNDNTLKPTHEAAIVYNLVDLALVAPEESYIDVARAFLPINRATNLEDSRFSNNMVLAAQTRLARELDQRPDLYDIYLVELLTLFGDKGVAIQNVATYDRHVKTEEMIEQLVPSLLPIEALITHPDYSPHLEKGAMTWLMPALAKIATKTPTLVLENAHHAASEIEYSTLIRYEHAHSVISKHRSFLARHIPHRASAIRSLSPGQAIFLLMMLDVESMRSAAGLPSSLVSYFMNGSLNRQSYLIVMRGCMGEMDSQAVEQALPAHLSEELHKLLVASTHRISCAWNIAAKYLFNLITSFPSLMCDPPLVYAILERLTLLRHACKNEFTDEYNPVYEFHSECTGITLQLMDDYKLQRNANMWFELTLSRAPIKLQSTLQKYLVATQPLIGADSAELGASVTETFAKALGPVHRQLSYQTGSLIVHPLLLANLRTNVIFQGRLLVCGLRLAARKNQDSLDKVAPQMQCTGVQPFKDKMADTMNDIWNKRSSLTVQDLQLLPFEVFTPSVVAAGIETWTWVIAERPNMEVVIMCKVLASWFGTVKEGKGVFSASSNCDDPFYHPIGYSPTNKDEIDRATTHAHWLLLPHTLVLQMLFSRLQAARYCRSTVMFLIQRLVLRSARAHKLFSTHPLARELPYTFLLFGLETLKSSHLDAVDRVCPGQHVTNRPVFIGTQGQHLMLHSCDRDSETVHFLLFIKAIALFSADQHDEANLLLKELGCPNADDRTCCIVEGSASYSQWSWSGTLTNVSDGILENNHFGNNLLFIKLSGHRTSQMRQNSARLRASYHSSQSEFSCLRYREIYASILILRTSHFRLIYTSKWEYSSTRKKCDDDYRFVLDAHFGDTQAIELNPPPYFGYQSKHAPASYKTQLMAHKAKIYVRRGGPNWQEGFQATRLLGESLGVPIRVFGPDTHITKIMPGHPPSCARLWGNRRSTTARHHTERLMSHITHNLVAFSTSLELCLRRSSKASYEPRAARTSQISIQPFAPKLSMRATASHQRHSPSRLAPGPFAVAVAHYGLTVGAEEIIPIPNLSHPQHLFTLISPMLGQFHDNARKQLLEVIMADSALTPHSALLESMEKDNEEELRKLDERLAEAEKQEGESEISDALKARANHLTQIGGKEGAVAAQKLALVKTPGLGSRIDMVLTLIRLGFFFGNNGPITENLPKAKRFIKEGGDWDRRNHLKVYRGLRMTSIRQLKAGSALLLNALSTFTATELNLITAPEVISVLPEIPILGDLLNNLYDCHSSSHSRPLGRHIFYPCDSFCLMPATMYERCASWHTANFWSPTAVLLLKVLVVHCK